MALAETPEPTGLAAVKHLLIDDEEGSAAVEFIILIPVYMLLMAGMFMLSQVMLIRQQLVGAARYEAWSGQDVPDEALKEPFFPGGKGTYSCSVTRSEKTTDREKLGGSGNAKEIAGQLLDNELGEGRPIVFSVAEEATFAYGGLLVGAREISVTTQSATYLMAPHTRPEHVEGRQDHFIERTEGAPSQAPSSEGRRYFSPVFGQFRGGFGGAGGDPGLWSRNARIGGNAQAEHGVFRRNDPANAR